MKEITIPKNTKNVLQYLIENGHEIDRQCIAGYCGTCRAKVLNGDIIHDREILAWIEDDECLPCCASTVSDAVILIN